MEFYELLDPHVYMVFELGCDVWYFNLRVEPDEGSGHGKMAAFERVVVKCYQFSRGYSLYG